MAVKRPLQGIWIVVILLMMVEIMNVKGSADMVARESDAADIRQEYLHVEKAELCGQEVQKKNAKSDQDSIDRETYNGNDSDGLQFGLYRTGRGARARARAPMAGPSRTFRHTLAKMRNNYRNHNNKTGRSTSNGQAALGQSRPSDDDGSDYDSDDDSELGTIWPAPTDLYLDAYFVHMKVGTPPVEMRMYLDTFTRITHMPCLDPRQPLQGVNVPPQVTVFDASQSSTYTKFQCGTECDRLIESAGCLVDYDQCGFRFPRMPDTSQVVRGRIAVDKFILDRNSAITVLMFGCTLPPRLPQPRGILGLGKGVTSFVEQLEEPGYFWCAPPDDVEFGVFGFGLLHYNPPNTMELPMARASPENALIVTDVKIDGVSVDVWHQMFGGNGPIMYFNLGDMSTQITHFLYPGFLQAFHVATERRGFVRNIAAGDACYDLPAVAGLHPNTNNFPNITFHFSDNAKLAFTNTKVLNPNVATMHPANPNLFTYCLPIQPTLLRNAPVVFLGQIHMEGLLVEMDNMRRKIRLTPNYCSLDEEY